MLAQMNLIKLHTVGDLLARDHTLGLYCYHCDRWSEAPLERLAREGWGRTPIVKLRFRCAVCGGPAQRQLRPPAMPPRTPGQGWIHPASLRAAGHAATAASATAASRGPAASGA